MSIMLKLVTTSSTCEKDQRETWVTGGLWQKQSEGQMNLLRTICVHMSIIMSVNVCPNYLPSRHNLGACRHEGKSWLRWQEWTKVRPSMAYLGLPCGWYWKSKELDIPLGLLHAHTKGSKKDNATGTWALCCRLCAVHPWAGVTSGCSVLLTRNVRKPNTTTNVISEWKGCWY